MKNTLDILIDFDGTCVTHEFPHVGQEIGAAQVLRDLVANGHRLILFTMRAEDCYLDDALAWFERHNISLYAINHHPKQSSFTSSPKALGDLLIDDTALGIQRIFHPDYRPFVDWQWVANALCERGLLHATQVAQYDFSAREKR